MFSLEFCKIFKSIYFVEHLQTTASEAQQIELVNGECSLDVSDLGSGVDSIITI